MVDQGELMLRNLAMTLAIAAALPTLAHAANSPSDFPPDVRAAQQISLLLKDGAIGYPRTPEELVDVVNKDSNPEVLARLGEPIAARLLTDDRLDVQSRELLPNDDPKRILDTYVVLLYENERVASEALTRFQKDPAIVHAGLVIGGSLSNTPNDPLFSWTAGTSALDKQWGMRFSQLGLEATWDYHFGAAYVGILDTGIFEAHEDLQWSYRPHFSTNFRASATCTSSLDEAANCGIPYAVAGHGTMVAGIVAASNGNGVGVSGACWNCSLMIGRIAIYNPNPSVDPFTDVDVANGMNGMTTRGAQVINLSLGFKTLASNYCLVSPAAPLCAAIAQSVTRQVALVAAVGNDSATFANFPASDSRVIAVGGIEYTGNRWNQLAALPTTVSPPDSPRHLNDAGAFLNKETGSNKFNTMFMAPARDILSTAYPNKDWNPTLRCGTTVTMSPSGQQVFEFWPYRGFASSQTVPYNRQYGICTGTSFAAPHISGIVGMIRGADPLQTVTQVANNLRQHSTAYPGFSSNMGYGIPNANTAVQSAITTNSRLTPLFSLYSPALNDYVFTISPQMAVVATDGTMLPRLVTDSRYYTFPWFGTYTTTYAAFPGIGPVQPGYTADNYKPRARLKVFTTKKDSSNVDLCHIFRYSKGGATIRHNYAICAADRVNIPATWTYDGVEGYMYPGTGAQPPGTIAVYRWVNPSTGAYTLVPNGDQALWTGRGFQSDGTGVLGYAYPN